MLEDSHAQIFFKIDSTVNLDILTYQRALYQKEKTKTLSLNISGKTIGKLHCHLLDEEKYEKTINLFFDNKLELPSHLNEKYVETIIKYLYFKEIPPISIYEIFELLKVALFMKLYEIYSKIIDFLLMNITDNKNANFILQNSYKIIYCFNEEVWGIMKETIEKSFLFLFKNQCFKLAFIVFDKKYFDFFKNKIEENFQGILSLMKKNNAPNEEKIQIISIFREELINFHQKKDKSFFKGKYFKTILEENIELNKMDMNELDSLWKKFDLHNSEIKDFSIKILSEKVFVLEQENNFLKINIKNLQDELEKKTNSQDLEIALTKKQFSEQNDIVLGLKTEIKNHKSLLEKRNTDLEKKFETRLKMEIISQFFFTRFPQFNKVEVLYDSTKHNINLLCERVSGKKNVAFIVEPSNYDLIFGAFYTIALPKTDKDLYYKDDNSCIFEIKKNQVFNADRNKNYHLRANPTYNYLFGYSGNKDGIYFFKSILYFGKKTDQFEGDNSFGFKSEQTDKLKRLSIYQLSE